MVRATHDGDSVGDKEERGRLIHSVYFTGGADIDLLI
jgi:hypothetical protein